MGIKQVQINTKSLKFGLVGMVNTLVDYTILNLLVFSLGVFAPAALVFCNVFSFLGANINSYVMNKRWTFEDRSGWSQNEYLVFLLRIYNPNKGIAPGKCRIPEFFDLRT